MTSKSRDVLGSIMDAVPRLTRRERRWLIHWLATKEYEADRVEEVTEKAKGRRGDTGGSTGRKNA